MTERAAVYVRVSTKDQAEDGWGLDDQKREGRQQIEGQHWTYVRTYDDGGRHGDRAEQDELERLLADAAAGEINVVVTKAMDRLGRNDGEITATLELLHNAGVRVFVAGRELDFDSPEGYLHTGIEKLFADYERRKIRARTKAGLRQRKESGQPMGPVPLGYTVEEYEREDGKTSTRRVIDPPTAAIVERIFDLVEQGLTFGDVARKLNAEGITGRRGNSWSPQTVRELVRRRLFVGENGYPAIIDRDRFDAIHANLTRLDPAQVAKRQGGRKPVDESFLLSGLAFCGRCGARMYVRRQKSGRRYVCRNVRKSTGLCDAPPIPAELLESHVLRHLDSFVGSVEAWLTERVNERQSERRERESALGRQRAKLTDIERKRDRHLAEYRKLVDAGKSTASIALEVVERIDRERAEQEQAIQEAEAVVSEWSGPPDLNAALDFYNRLVDHVHGRIEKAEGVVELHDALSTVVSGLWAGIEDDRLLAEFELVGAVHAGDPLPTDRPIMFGRPALPPRSLDDRSEPRPLADPAPLSRRRQRRADR